MSPLSNVKVQLKVEYQRESASIKVHITLKKKLQKRDKVYEYERKLLNMNVDLKVS